MGRRYLQERPKSHAGKEYTARLPAYLQYTAPQKSLLQLQEALLLSDRSRARPFTHHDREWS